MMNTFLTRLNLKNAGLQINQATIRGILKDQSTLNSTVSTGSVGLWIVGFSAPSHASLPGLAHGDIIRVTGANATSIFSTFAEAPPIVNVLASGTYNSFFVKTGDIVHRWSLISGVATFSNADYSIANLSASLIMQTGTLNAQRTVTLPPIATTPIGYTMRVLDASGTASLTGYIRIIGSGTDAINGNSTATMPIFITQPYGEVELTCSSTGWIAVESKKLARATVQFASQTISATGNLTFSACTIANGGISGGSGYVTFSGSGTNKFTVGPGRWKVKLNMGAQSGSNGWINTALCGASTGGDLGPAWSNGYIMNTGRSTDFSSNFGGWNEFNVSSGTTQDCFFRVWGIGGSISISSWSFLEVEQIG